MSKIELFHSSRTFQDRRRPSVAGIDRKSRLYLQNRFKGCIRSSSYARRIQGLPKFRKRRGSIPLQVPGVWPKRSSKNFFQNNEVCNRTAQERRDSGNLLSERHLHPSQDEGRNESIDNQGETSFRKAWLHYQLQEEHPHPIKDSGIFRISVQQQDHDHFSTRVEDYKFNEENPSGGDDSNEDMQMDSRFIGEDDVNDTSSRRSSIKYQVFTEGSIEDITPDTPKLGDNLQIVNTSLQESSWWEMFLTQKNGLPIQKITAANSKTTIHVDVSNSGWGVSSDMITASGFWNQEGEQKSIHVRELKTILFALQHHAPKCGNSIIKIYSDNITAKSGGTTTIILQDLAIQIQELQPIQHTRHVSTHPGDLEHSSRPAEQTQESIVRIDISEENVQSDPTTMGTVENRRVCSSTQQPAANLLVSNTRPNSCGNGCNETNLVTKRDVSVSTLEVNSASVEEDS